MIDIDAAVVNLAEANSTLVTAVSGQIYAGDAPPAEWNPATGAVVMKSRGGQSEIVLDVSIQAKCYGATAVDAWSIYQYLCAALDGTYDGVIADSRIEQVGQQLTEPSTGRVYILAYFRMRIRP